MPSWDPPLTFFRQSITAKSSMQKAERQHQTGERPSRFEIVNHDDSSLCLSCRWAPSRSTFAGHSSDLGRRSVARHRDWRWLDKAYHSNAVLAELTDLKARSYWSETGPAAD